MADPAPASWFLRSRLKLRHIQLVVAVDEERSIHKAALRLRMTQPAATKLLAELEHLLDVRLYERTTRGIIPTPHGESLARHARAVLGTLDNARRELAALSAGATGRLAIGMLAVAAPLLVPRALLAFKRRNPRVTVELHEGTLGALLPMLARGDLDLVVGRLTSDFDTGGFAFVHCYDEPMSVVARRDHPLRRRRNLTLADLVRERWVLPIPDAAYRHRLDAAFRQSGVEPPAELVESMSILTNATLLEESDMLGVMPLNTARHYARGGTLALLKVPLPLPSGPVGVIARSEQAEVAALQDLVAALRAAGEALDRGKHQHPSR
jgi:DNA-binding transcriptional LysR family regulator